MGLDMYLTKQYHVSAWHDRDGNPMNERDRRLREMFPHAATEGSWQVEVPAMYWRKANAIHNWFVKNVQDGTDDCDRYHVLYEQLVELYHLVSSAINLHEQGDDSVAAKELPPTAGFFFGSREMDEWYWEDMKRTKVELGKTLRLHRAEPMGYPDGGEFFYQSSW